MTQTMRGRLLTGVLSAVAALAAALAVCAQTPPPAPRAEFATVEVEGWDFSSFDEEIREAVSKANARGAGEAERRAAAAALSARADFFYEAGEPVFYRFALGDYRRVLRLRPDDARARERADTIAGIYRSMARPVPTYGEARPDGSLPVELFRTKPRRLDLDPGKLLADTGDVTDRVAFVYEFAGRAGQSLRVRVKSRDEAVFDLLLRQPGGPLALVKGRRVTRRPLPSDGEYLIRVYSRHGAADYELNVELMK